LAEKSTAREELMDRSTEAEWDNSLYPIVQIWVRHGLLDKVQGLKLESACLSNGNNLIAGLASLGFMNTEPFMHAVAEEITTLLPKESHLKSAILTNGLYTKSSERRHLSGNDQTDHFKEMICAAENDFEYALALQIAISEWVKKIKGEGAEEHRRILGQLWQVFYALGDGDLEGALRRLADNGKRGAVNFPHAR
jgi:hypothetical protein